MVPPSAISTIRPMVMHGQKAVTRPSKEKKGEKVNTESKLNIYNLKGSNCLIKIENGGVVTIRLVIPTIVETSRPLALRK